MDHKKVVRSFNTSTCINIELGKLEFWRDTMKLTTHIFRIFLAVFIVLALVANLQPGAAQSDESRQALPSGGNELWKTNLSLGPNAWLYAVVARSNGDVFVAGDMDSIGSIQTGRVARWGASDHIWHTLGKGITWGRIYALAISEPYLYVGGYFDAVSGTDIPANGIARWNMNTNTWSNVGGSGFSKTSGSPDVYALAVDGSGNVYAAGDFTAVNTTPVMNVAKWNGSTWSALGSGLGTTSNQVHALVWQGTKLIAGGNFTSHKNIAFWDTALSSPSWTTLGGGTDNDVIALAADSSFIYAGGAFRNVYYGATTVPVHYIAQWTWSSGGYWQDMNGGFDGPDVDALAVGPDGKVYAGGRFSQSGTTNTSNLARWNSGNWEAVHSTSIINEGVNGNVYALAFSGQDMWVAGGFQSGGSYSADYLIKFNLDDQQWITPGGNAPNGQINAVLVRYPNIYYGGAFTYAGGIQINGVARYNMPTNTWSALGSGLSGYSGLFYDGPVVNALAIYANSLYVGGNFQGAGGVTVHNLARFDLVTNTWYDVGGGISTCSTFLCTPVVNALFFAGGNLFVGGYFNKAGIYTVNNVAEWSGGNWYPLTDSTSSLTGTNGSVNAIGMNPMTSDIYLGGTFTSPATRITRWNGTHWYSVGLGTLNGNVNAVDYLGSSLYIGGSFTNAGGSGANYLARLSGSSWVAVGGSVNGAVRALADNNSELLVGGDFSTAGALQVNHVARWTGSQWIALGTGVHGVSGFEVNPTVNAIDLDSNFVYLGGTLRSAGPYISDNIAIWGGYETYMPLVIH
jgi:hypothetical protein